VWIAAPVAVLALFGATIAVAARGQDAPVLLDAEDSVTICHYTGNDEWVQLSPNANGVLSGHEGHDQDIIPPFTYTDGNETRQYPGRNWDDAGREIYFAGPDSPACTRPPPPPPPPARPIGVFVDCIDNSDGTFDAVFGYESGNSIPVTVPRGPANELTPARFDGQQVETFEPGNVASAFRISGIQVGESVTWSVSHGGETHSAHCTPPTGPEPAIEVTLSVCVVPGPTTFEARFGTYNRGEVEVTVQWGAANRVEPESLGAGRPIVFLPGENPDALRIGGIPNGTTVTWSLTTGGVARSAAASTASPACPGTPEPPAPPTPPDPAAQPIGVFVECIRDHGATFDAVFGFQNQNADAVGIPAGSANGFAPAPVERGQVTEFTPGNVQRAFTVEGIARGTELTWAVTHAGETRTATVSALFPDACDDDPDAAEPIGIFACIRDNGSTFDAVFGYENDNPVAVSLPIGVRNHVDPGGPNRGQPIIFLPGKELNAFTVRGVPSDGFVAWTVSYRGLRSVIVTAAHPVVCAGAEPDLSVRPFAFCSRRTGNTFTAVFGYVNTNREDVIVPIGARNRIAPGSADQGQPITFRSGNAFTAFAVRNVPVGRTVTWSVTTFGVTRTATVDVDTRECVRTPVEDPVDVAVTKTARPATVAAGGRVDYTLVVRNVGRTTAYAVTVEDVRLDGRVRLLSAATSRGRCGLRERSGGRAVVCFLGDLAPGESATIAIGARAVTEGISRNRALVLSLPLDSGANNSAVASVRVRPGSGVLGEGVRPPFTG
jgi:uncharacterized repeat protein (TIGR01451 family)